MHRSKLELSWAFYMRAEAIFSSLRQASPIQRERPASPYMRGPALAFSSSIMVTAAPAAAIRAPEGLRITTSASTPTMKAAVTTTTFRGNSFCAGVLRGRCGMLRTREISSMVVTTRSSPPAVSSGSSVTTPSGLASSLRRASTPRTRACSRATAGRPLSTDLTMGRENKASRMLLAGRSIASPETNSWGVSLQSSSTRGAHSAESVRRS
mmetsp:Transcript_43866/g.99170  ORF Transcript_43866/g.99170 Transcript_43866/m.99170 type:complete len:210 (+) Transcript_43866:505-1134(+)